MAGLGLLLGLGTRLFGNIAYGVADAKAMSKPSYYLDDGTPVYTNRKNQDFANGEQIIATYDYVNDKLVYAGKKTGKVYIDPEEIRKKKRDERNRERKESAIKRGYLAYQKYDPKFKRHVTCEISTGKIIAGLTKSNNGKCRKIYAAPNDYFCNITATGDNGVEITLEEYEKLDIVGGSHWKVE